MGRKALEVLQDIADQIGWKQPTTLEQAHTLDKDQRKLIRSFNRVLRAMSGINDWRFLRKQGEIELLAEYTTGLMQLTNGSTAVVGSADTDGNTGAWTSAMIGRAIVLQGHPVVYRIASQTSATALTLDRQFVGTTSDGGTTLADYDYRIVQDRYDLPVDFDRPADEDWTRYDGGSASPVRLVDPNEIRSRRLRRVAYSVGDPEVVTLWMNDDAGEHRMAIFDSYPKSLRVVRFDYHIVHPQMELDNQRILFDQKQEELIMSGVEFLLLRGPEDDQRAQLMLGEYLQQQQTAVAKTEIGQERTRITASQDRAFHQRAKWRRRGRGIHWGSRFDRVDFYDL